VKTKNVAARGRQGQYFKLNAASKTLSKIPIR
jgi:hypothetical protein